jgi:serine-type D-Ala-D-Ala carboxypeptidase/endopeptidase (penicillin-binding protein 4)
LVDKLGFHGLLLAFGTLPVLTTHSQGTALGIPARPARRRVVWDCLLGFALTFGLTFVSVGANSAQPDSSPAQLIAKLGFAPSEVGFLLVDLASGKVLEEKSADQLFMPASVAKLATAYAAEQNLGADFRFSTLLFRRGANVYLEGGGDPVLTANDLQRLAAELRAAKSGGVGGRFFYSDVSLPALPEVSDSQPVATPYNAGLSALNLDFNRIEVTWLRPRKGGELIFQARTIADGLILPSDWITFAPAVDALPPGAPFLYAGNGILDRWQYSALLPDSGDTFLPVRGTSLHTALAFRQLALAAGIALAAPEPGHVPGNALAIAHVESPPLSEILSGLLRYSNNAVAELIGLAASRKLTGQSLSLADSSKALTLWLEHQSPGTDWRGFHLENHSGLSAKSRLSPRQMIGLLTLIARDPALMAALPPREDGGGIASPAKNPEARPIMGKSGTMDYARGLAGFFPARDGRLLAFAIFIFDPTRRVQLDATMDRRVLEPSPAALNWIRRAVALDDALLKSWLAKF